MLTGDLVAAMPERAARQWAQEAEFVVMRLKEPKLSFEYRVIWHERDNRDPGLRWLRDLVVMSFTAAGP